MPEYTFTCQSDHVKTVYMAYEDFKPLTTCDECGGPLKQVYGFSGIHFKGTGWGQDYQRAREINKPWKPPTRPSIGYGKKSAGR